MVQLLLQEAGTPWPSLSALIPAVPSKKDERMIDFRVAEPGLQPSELLDGESIAPIPVPKDKPLSMSAARAALRASLQRSYSLLPFSTSDVLPRNVAPLFTAYYGTAPSVAPQRHHPSHPHTLYYAAAWSSWRCQLCQQTVARQVRNSAICVYSKTLNFILFL